MRRVLDGQGKEEVARSLAGASLEFHTESQFARRANAYWASVILKVSADRLAVFNDRKIRADLLSIASSLMGPDLGYDLDEVVVTALLEAPPQTSEPLPPTWKPRGVIEHDGVYFRSKTEIKIYDVLKKRAVLFFVNATAVLGGKELKREPDFLVCQGGKWGILEVMGEPYHPATTAMQDHDRARLFKDYGVVMIEFYGSERCYRDPEGVVTDFLKRLERLA